MCAVVLSVAVVAVSTGCAEAPMRSRGSDQAMANAVRFAVDLSGLDERFATLGFQRTASVAGSNMFFGVVPESASQFFVVYHEPGPGQDGIEDFADGLLSACRTRRPCARTRRHP